MPFQLDEIIPWGRSFNDYIDMFGLKEVHLSGRILGGGDGPSSFNAEADALGIDVVSVDPLYALPFGEIKKRIDASHDIVLQELRENRKDYVWERYPTPEAMCEARIEAMERFLSHFSDPRTRARRYIAGAFPSMPFAKATFDLALVSHVLFFYTEQLSLDLHLAAIRDLYRVAQETRVFPIVGLNGTPSPFIKPVIRELGGDKCRLELTHVKYEIQYNVTSLMCVRPPVPIDYSEYEFDDDDED